MKPEEAGRNPIEGEGSPSCTRCRRRGRLARVSADKVLLFYWIQNSIRSQILGTNWPQILVTNNWDESLQRSFIIIAPHPPNTLANKKVLWTKFFQFSPRFDLTLATYSQIGTFDFWKERALRILLDHTDGPPWSPWPPSRECHDNPDHQSVYSCTHTWSRNISLIDIPML